ncbi:LysR family transcriptional regulator [Bosea sp. 685]|uniref:LysR family transcriptional regulator n=1 Tax=Bosea sp. 685 TaxID=3080057 RepID=UPI0028937B37|nr:LysR family transcriptional regulator [Bosea sp. 685]WNJ92709.1 LysR substrate-binding domain-containing protein [Bosea sp. 685]
MPVKPPRPRLPSLNALRAFEAAARCESFVKAAEELGVTAGAVTQQIRQLEAWLGFPLFRRLAQGVELTESARNALPKLTRGFDTLGQAVQELRAGHEGRTLTIAALPCIAQLWLSPRLAALQAAFPGLQISVSAMEQPPDPRREPHDLALFYLGAEAIPADALTLGPDMILPVCAPALARTLTSVGDLAHATLLHDAVWREDWRRWLAFTGSPGTIDPTRGPSFSLYSLALDAALSGSGVLMGRMSLIAPWLDSGRLIAPFATAKPTGDMLCLTEPHDHALFRRRPGVASWFLESKAVSHEG